MSFNLKAPKSAGVLTHPSGPQPGSFSGVVEGEPETPHISCMLWMLGMVGAIGGFLFGYDTGSISTAMLEIKLPKNESGLGGDAVLSDAKQGLITSFVVFGAFFSALTAGKLNEHLGRRKVLIVGSILFGVGSVLQGLAWSLPPLVVARFISGLGVGLNSHSVPLYLSECAPANLRGSLCFLNDMFIVVGQVCSAAVGTAFFYGEVEGGWRFILSLSFVPAMCMLIGFCLMPESPRYLVMAKDIDGGREVLKRLRHGMSERAVEAELQEIRTSVQKEMGWRPAGLSKYFTDVSIRRPLLLGCGLQLLQQWVGINTIVYYGSSILQKSDACSSDSGDDLNPFSPENQRNVALSILVNSAQLAGVLLSWFFVDKFGRRPLILSSLVGVIMTLGIMGGVYTADQTSKGAVVAAMMAYLVFFGVGMSPVPWTINAEIYPLDVRAKCISMSTATNWLMNYVVAQTFLPISVALSTSRDCPRGHPNGVFWLFAGIGIIGFLVVRRALPETRGKGLEEIAELFVRPGDDAVLLSTSLARGT